MPESYSLENYMRTCVGSPGKQTTKTKRRHSLPSLLGAIRPLHRLCVGGWAAECDCQRALLHPAVSDRPHSVAIGPHRSVGGPGILLMDQELLVPANVVWALCPTPHFYPS